MRLIVDAANVVGSRPDGWWKDRAGAARRLRRVLETVAEQGLPGGGSGPLPVILVVEGRASELVADAGPSSVQVVAAPGSGDDTIVDLVRASPDPTTVVTADRALRERVRALGAEVLGPRGVGY